MKEAIALKWAEALESGEYAQGREVLTRIEGEKEFDCCLGVLCKLAIADGVDLSIHIADVEVGQPRGDDEEYNKVPAKAYDLSMRTLPRQVQVWAEMRSAGGEYVYTLPTHEGPMQGSLSGFNDRGDTFVTIAGYIRQNVRSL